MKPTEAKIDRRAVHIAAVCLVAAGVCRYDDSLKCRKLVPDDNDCTKCIEKWLRMKARQELRNGSQHQ